MSSLAQAVKWEQQTERALLMLTHAHDAVLFSGDFTDSEVWSKTLRTLRIAKLRVVLAAALGVTGGSDGRPNPQL